MSNITNLPNEFYSVICDFLGYQTTSTFSRTCKTIHAQLNEQPSIISKLFKQRLEELANSKNAARSFFETNALREFIPQIGSLPPTIGMVRYDLPSDRMPTTKLLFDLRTPILYGKTPHFGAYIALLIQTHPATGFKTPFISNTNVEMVFENLNPELAPQDPNQIPNLTCRAAGANLEVLTKRIKPFFCANYQMFQREFSYNSQANRLCYRADNRLDRLFSGRRVGAICTMANLNWQDWHTYAEVFHRDSEGNPITSIRLNTQFPMQHQLDAPKTQPSKEESKSPQ